MKKEPCGFTVTVNTVMERSKIPLCKWVMAAQLMASSKKGMSAHQLHRTIGTTYETAWFLFHRLRECAADPKRGPIGGKGKIVEADETFIGGKEKNRHRSKRAKVRLGGNWGKETVFSLVERGGAVRSQHVASVSARTLRPILFAQVDRKSTLMTDDAGQYRILGREYARHESVNHGIEEYVRGDAYTNTVESYFALLKRGMMGSFHSVSKAHLHRYLAEFDFRYNTREMTESLKSGSISGAAGNRRDKLLLKLLKTPPQPRPKREREKSVTPKGKKAKKTPIK